MCVNIAAPQGYEAQRVYDDGIREWRAYARPVGFAWWTKIGAGCGHPQMTPAELDANAVEQVRQAVEDGSLKA